MDKNEKLATEQEAPLKNSDDAFVQVGHDGSPVFPTEEADEKELSRSSTQPSLPGKS